MYRNFLCNKALGQISKLSFGLYALGVKCFFFMEKKKKKKTALLINTIQGLTNTLNAAIYKYFIKRK